MRGGRGGGEWVPGGGQDTGDTRETPAIDVCKGLIGDNAQLHIYDPQVSNKQMLGDLATPKCPLPPLPHTQTHARGGWQLLQVWLLDGCKHADITASCAVAK